MGEGEARWSVDPLDGTTNYAHDLSIFTLSVALDRAGEVVVGVVYGPMAEEMYAAERGSGVTLNGQPIEVSDTDELIQALLASSFSSDREGSSASPDLFGKGVDCTQGWRLKGKAERPTNRHSYPGEREPQKPDSCSKERRCK